MTRLRIARTASQNRDKDRLRLETSEERFRIYRTWKVDCHEESIGRLDLHFLNPRTRRRGEKTAAEEVDGESSVHSLNPAICGREVHDDSRRSSGKNHLIKVTFEADIVRTHGDRFHPAR